MKVCEVSKYSTHNYTHRTNVSSHVLVLCGVIEPMLCIHHHNYFEYDDDLYRFKEPLKNMEEDID